MARLSGKTAVITGGSSGIGLATAKTFVDEGAHVLIVGRNVQALMSARETLGANVFILEGDMTSATDLAKLAKAVEDDFGTIDILFVNAGVAEFLPLQQADEAHFDKIFGINVRGAYFTVKAIEPYLAAGASVILTTSSSNVLGLPGSSVYAASKAALRSFARTLSAELVGRGIRVNAISPGPTDTPIYDRMDMTEAEQTEAEQTIVSRVPMGRMGRPTELALSALFLATDDSRFMAGAELVVDGGMSQI